MARRPENPRNRGRRSDSSLDWLSQEDQPEQQPGSAPAGDGWQVLGSAQAPRADPLLHPDPGAGTDPQPRADPGAPLLGRRAARAQREALQAKPGRGRANPARADQTRPDQTRADQTRAGRAWAGPPPAGRAWAEQTQVGQAWTGPVPAEQSRARPTRANQSRARPVPADQTQAGQAWTHQFPVVPPGAAGPVLTDQTQVGLAWTGPAPAPAELVQPAQPITRQRTARTPGTPPDAPPSPKPEPKAHRRRRGAAIWLTLASLLPAAWSATSFIDSDNLVIAGPAAIAPLVCLVALPVIALGVASKHLVPTVIAVVAALLPWTLVTGYAAAGPGGHDVGSKPTLRVLSVDGAEGRASAQDIVQVTRLYAVDVIVVTDLTSELAHDLTVAGLSALAPARWVDAAPGEVHGTGLWARPKIGTLTPITGLGRSGVDGVIEAGTAKIGISVVHLAGEPLRPGKNWRSDLAALATRTPPAKDSFIVGDLNASPWHPAFRRLTESKWRDAADVIGQGLRPTWPAWSPLPISPADHVLASPGLGVAGADTTNIGGSTHRALIVTLILPTAGAAGD